MPNLKITLLDCGSAKFDALDSICARHGSTRVLTLEGSPVNPGDLEDCDALVISGGPHLFTAEDAAARERLEQRFDFLRQPGPPVLGICLGMQALALVAGGTIYRGPERRDRGAIHFDTGTHPLLRGLPSGTAFAEDHCEGVTSPPPGFAVLGHSDAYPVEIIADEVTQRYGVQFHPEVSGPAGEKLIGNFFSLLQPGD